MLFPGSSHQHVLNFNRLSLVFYCFCGFCCFSLHFIACVSMHFYDSEFKAGIKKEAAKRLINNVCLVNVIRLQCSPKECKNVHFVYRILLTIHLLVIPSHDILPAAKPYFYDILFWMMVYKMNLIKLKDIFFISVQNTYARKHEHTPIQASQTEYFFFHLYNVFF